MHPQLKIGLCPHSTSILRREYEALPEIAFVPQVVVHLDFICRPISATEISRADASSLNKHIGSQNKLLRINTAKEIWHCQQFKAARSRSLTSALALSKPTQHPGCASRSRDCPSRSRSLTYL